MLMKNKTLNYSFPKLKILIPLVLILCFTSCDFYRAVFGKFSIYFLEEEANSAKGKFTRILFIVKKDALTENLSMNLANDFQNRINKCGIETKLYIKNPELKNSDSTELKKIINEFNPNGLFFLASDGLTECTGRFTNSQMIYYKCNLKYRDNLGHYSSHYRATILIDPNIVDKASEKVSAKLYKSLGRYNKQFR